MHGIMNNLSKKISMYSIVSIVYYAKSFLTIFNDKFSSSLLRHYSFHLLIEGVDFLTNWLLLEVKHH